MKKILVYKNNTFISNYYIKQSATDQWIRNSLDNWFGPNNWSHFIF